MTSSYGVVLCSRADLQQAIVESLADYGREN